MRLYKFVLLFSTLLLLGCGGSSENEEPPPLTSSIKILLDKDLLTVAEQTEVKLGASIVANTSIVSTNWQQVSGSEVTLNVDQMGATFIAPTVLLAEGDQDLIFRFTVTGQDDSVESADVTVTITPVNQLPAVVTTVERTMDSEKIAKLTAIATDGDGSIVSYLWHQTAGANVAIEDYQQAQIQFSLNDLSSELLTFTVTATDNEGGTSVKELSINVAADLPNITTEAEVVTNSGATTLIEWQNIENNKSLKFDVVQVTGQKTLLFNTTEDGFIYFDAPIVIGEPQVYQLSLSITDNTASQFNIPISVTINLNSGSFDDVETILTTDDSGLLINSFTTQDIDNDGITDIVAYHEDGVYWYRNLGDFDIGSKPTNIYYKKNSYRYFYGMKNHFFKDIDGDNYIDFVFLDYDKKNDKLMVKYKKNNGNGQFISQFDMAEIVDDSGTYSLSGAELLNANNKTDKNIFSVVINADSFSDTRSKSFIIEQTNEGFISSEAIEIFGSITDVQSCQLPGTTETSMFLDAKTDYHSTSSLYLASSVDNYQSTRLLSKDAGSYANLLCYQLPNKSNRLFFTYGYGNSREIVFSLAGGFEELTVATGLTSGIEANYQLLDINQDGVNEVIKYGSWGNASTIFSFDVNSATDLFKPMANFKLNSSSNSGTGKVTYWQESNSFHLFRGNNNRLELSEQYTLGELINYQSLGYSFKAPEYIKNIRVFNNDLVVNSNINNGKEYQEKTYRLHLPDNKLSINIANDIVNFGDQIPTLVDMNNDHILDAVYTQVIPWELGLDCGYRTNVKVMARYGVIGGSFSEPEKLNIETECAANTDIGQDKQQRVVVQDINLDGWLDLGIRDSYWDSWDGYYQWDVTQWWLYMSENEQYIKKTNPIFNTDINTYPQTQKLIGDVNNDGLSDVFKLTAAEEDYQLGGLRGVPSAQLALSDDSFTELIVIDDNALFKFTTLADVNLDGQPDYIAHVVYPENEAENIATGIWYRWNASGEFEKIEIPLVSKTYVDLNGDGNSYFVNNEQAEKLIKYRFDSKIEKPVVAEVISNEALPSNGQRLLVDIDGDDDLDIIFWDHQKVYMMRNLHH
jgi:hypothetical protein